MKTATLPVEVKDNLRELLMDGKAAGLPEDMRESLKAFASGSMSAVDATVQLAELIYARKDEAGIAVELLQLGADAAVVANEYNFHGMRETGRGAGIDAELRKIKGVKAPAPVVKTAPEPEARYKRGGAAAPGAPASPGAGAPGQGNKPA